LFGSTTAVLTSAGAFTLAGNQTSDIDTITGQTLKIGASTQTGLTLGRAGATTTINGSSLTIGPTSWTATPTISGLITGTSGVSIAAGQSYTGAGAVTVSTGANGNLTLTPNGTGNIVLTSTAVSGTYVGSSTNTPAVLSVSGGIANNGALIVNNLNSGDLIDASASGTTKFSVTGAGLLKVASGGGLDTLAASGTLNIGQTNTTTLVLGNSSSTFALTSSGGLNVTTGGALTGVSSIDTVTHSATSLGFANAGTISTGNNSDFTITPNGTGNIILTSTATSGVRVGSSSNTPAVLSVSGGIANNGALIVNNLNSGDLIDASASGTTKFSVTNGGSLSLASGAGIDSIAASGTINVGTGANTSTLVLGKSGGTTQLAELTTNGVVYTSGGNGTLNSEAQVSTAQGGLGASVTAAGGGEILYSTGTTTYSHLAAGNSGYCLTSGGTGAPSWQQCATGTGGTNFWQLNSGALSPFSNTTDLLLGGTATTAAKFAFIGVNSGTPVASLSAQTAGGPALSVDAAGNIQTYDMAPITIGSTTTGAINVGTDATARAITIGNATGATNLTLKAGTGNINLFGSTTAVLTSAGAFTLAGNQTSDIDTITGQTLKIGASTQTGLTLG
ncbi:MAG: hypothetical protein KGL95_12375, partial [Patescibacteria group bacterium]|nr:hypothetical protein [Patescibacteria group bacterium]